MIGPPQTCSLLDLHLLFSALTPCQVVLAYKQMLKREIPGQVFKHPVGNPISPIIRKHIVAVAADVIQTRESESHDLTNAASRGTWFGHQILLVPDYKAGLLLARHDGRGSGDASSEWETWNTLPLLLLCCQPPPSPLTLPAHQPAHRGRPGHSQALDGRPHLVHTPRLLDRLQTSGNFESADRGKVHSTSTNVCLTSTDPGSWRHKKVQPR